MKRIALFACMLISSLFVLTACGESKLTWENGEKIDLWEDTEKIPYYDESDDQVVSSITPYVTAGNDDGKAVILIPGGGYAVHGDLETEKEVADALNEKGISAFILDYRVAPYDGKAYMSDSFRAVRFVRYYADSFGIDPERITVMGFSAGGHLALMTMEHFNDELDVSGDKIDKESARPNAGVLCYPVSSFKDDYTHEKSRMNFLGEENQYNEEKQEEYSGECGVTADTPPAFIWHTQNDQAVPYESSELLKEAFDEACVECELMLFKYGSHGLGLAKDIEGVQEWFPNCIDWLDKIYE